MKLIVLLEEIRPLRTVEEGVETLVRRIVQGVADLEHAATDSETGQRIQKLVNELQGLYGAAAHAIVTGTQAAIDEVEVLVDDVEDEIEGDDDSTTPAAPVSAAPVSAAPVSAAPPAPAPLPGTSPAAAQMASSPEPAPAPIPPIGAPGANGSGPSTPAELVDNLNSQHEAAKADSADDQPVVIGVDPGAPGGDSTVMADVDGSGNISNVRPLEGNDAALAGMGSPAASGAVVADGEPLT